MESKETYEWILKIINTCTNDFHFDAVDNLIELHYKKFGDEQLKTELQLEKVRKWNDIHTVLS